MGRPAVGLKTLHICLQVGDTHPGGTLYMHQWQATGGDQALDSPQGNIKLPGGFALGYQQSSGHGRRIRRGAPRVEHWDVLRRPYAIGQESHEIFDLGRSPCTFSAQLAQISG
jgi:hypothetical protein